MRIHVLTIFCILIGAIGCNQKITPHSDTVADIDGVVSVNFTELQRFYSNQFYDRRFPDDSLKGFQAALDEYIVRRQKQIDFVESGLHHDDELMQEIQRSVNEEIIVKYFNEEFLSKYINEETVQDYYNDMGREVIYRQIYIEKDPSLGSEAIQAAINQIRKELAEGTDFGELAERFSEHTESAKNKGMMPPINWENSYKSRLHNTIFNMSENVVRTLETSKGYYIIKVGEINKIDIPPLPEVREDIEYNMRELYLNRSLQEYDEMKKNLIDENSYEWNEEALEQLVQWSKQEGFYEEYYQDTLQQALERGNNFIILTHGNGKVDLQKFLDLLNKILIPGNPDNLSRQDFIKFIDDAIRTELIVQQAKDLGYNENIISYNNESSVIRYYLWKLYNKAKIQANIPEPTQANLRQFYEAHKDSLLYQFAKVNLFVKGFETRSEAEEMWSKIEASMSFEEAADKTYEINTLIIDFNGDTLSFISREKPYLKNHAFELEEGEVAGPVQYEHDNKGTQFAIIKSARKLPAKQLAFDEVKDIERKYRDYYIKKLEREVREKLEEKYPTTVYNDVLQEKVNSLN